MACTFSSLSIFLSLSLDLVSDSLPSQLCYPIPPPYTTTTLSNYITAPPHLRTVDCVCVRVFFFFFVFLGHCLLLL